MIYEANESSSACGPSFILQVEANTPPVKESIQFSLENRKGGARLGSIEFFLLPAHSQRKVFIDNGPGFIGITLLSITHQPLRLATEEERKKTPAAGDEALIREDGQVLYPIRNGIPLLVPSEAIPIS